MKHDIPKLNPQQKYCCHCQNAIGAALFCSELFCTQWACWVAPKTYICEAFKQRG